MVTGRSPRGSILLLTGLLLALSAAPGAAQRGHEGFLLKRPSATFGFQMGYTVPNASSEIFDFVQDELTVEKSDFHAPSLGGNLAVWIAPRLDLRVDVTWSRSTVASEFRDWVDLDNLPIEQETTLQRVPLTVGLKWYLSDRGRSIGRFAWVPEDVNAYLGAAGGVTFYRFEQEGDFVDFETLDIFYETFSMTGTTPTAHLYGGVDYTLSPNLLASLEGRYAWTRGVEMSGDFVGFEPMDLSGLQASVGFSVRF